MLWVKSFHLIFLISWFAGLFYLPRLFVYHAMSDDEISNERFKIMERKLLGLMALAATLTTVFGLWMLYEYAWLFYSSMMWLHIKLLLVAVYHLYQFFSILIKIEINISV